MSLPDPPLDRRLNVYRPSLADERLRGKVEADRFAEGTPMQVASPSAPLRREPRAEAPQDTEALCGETVRVFDVTADGWAWAQLDADGYVGWLPSGALRTEAPRATHVVTALRTFLYPGPDLKLPPIAALSMGSRLAFADETVSRGVAYRLLSGGSGAVVSRHIRPLGQKPDADFVATAEMFERVPYLWGGRTSLGLDCSGLLQLALQMSGRSAPRDSDLQEMALGTALAEAERSDLTRGDLVFWKGHVGVMVDATRLLHANAHHMAVAIEPLSAAIERIRRGGADITGVRRL